jgi:hypothetical protein
MASSSAMPGNLWFGNTVTKKLSRTNHAMWKAQVVSALIARKETVTVSNYLLLKLVWICLVLVNPAPRPIWQIVVDVAMALVVATTMAVVVVAAVASIVVVAVAMDAATSPTISVKAITAEVVVTTPLVWVQATMVGLFVRFASRKDTLQIGVGIVLRRIMFLTRSMHPRP